MEFFFRGGGNPTDWNILGEGKIVLHRTRYSNLVGCRFPGAELSARGGAARIKASCGIKNLCNQLSNLLPHISRPMSRPPPLFYLRSLRFYESLLDPPSTLFSRGGCSSPPFPTSLSSPSPVEPLLLSVSCTASRREERERERRALRGRGASFVWDIKYLFS